MKIDIRNFKIRLFEPTDVDYAATVEIVNQSWSNSPSTVEMWKHDDSILNPKRFEQRFIGEIENENTKRIVAVGFITGSRIGAKKTGKYHIPYYIDREYKGQGLDEPFYMHLITALADKKPSELGSLSREDNVAQIEFLKQKGFKQIRRISNSELDLPSFDFSPFVGYSEKVASSGIAIVDLQELQASDSDWMQKLYDLEMAIRRDVPGEFTPAGLKEYGKHFEKINFQADAWFVAVDANNYVGMSSLWPNKVLENLMGVGITGVLPSHRRRGIGATLKLKTIEFAQAYGANTIETDNEENNPMYVLNMRLGFQPTPGWLIFEKVL